MPELVWKIPWLRTGDKSLSKPMIALFTDAYMYPSHSEILVPLDINRMFQSFQMLFQNIDMCIYFGN